MTQNQTVFQRYEKKYLLNRRQYRRLLQLLNGYITADHYGRHTIGNIYFDTDHFELIRNSLNKPDYKEKLRLRCYGTPTAEDTVFLEIKKKVCGIVYKRRSEMTLLEAYQYLANGKRPQNAGQILKETDWFLSRYPLSAKVFLAYDRTAYYCNIDEDLRITFDENIRWREDNLDLSRGSFGKMLLPESQVLMEIKIPGAMPLWLSQILTQLHIYPASFSKYGTCYEKFLMPRFKEKGGVHCA